MPRLSIALKTFRQLGPRSSALYALYQLGLRTGYYRRLTPDPKPLNNAIRISNFGIRPLLPLPSREQLAAVLGQAGRTQLLGEADELVAGKVRLFGGKPVPLDLTPPGSLEHWTRYENLPTFQPSNLQTDIKVVWEPARFGWAFTLGRAYHLNQDERYPEAFWRYAEVFLEGNPPYRGPNWASAQEVALRLMAFTFAAQVFAPSPHSTPQRLKRLSQAIADHAARIPSTMIYARAQNNNHLLSESAGLITAALALPDHPQSPHWLALGQKWFTQGLQSQIAPDGAYTQHSTNYHRMMLHLALWIRAITLSPSHPVTLSPSHPVTESPRHPVTESPSHPVTLSPSHSVTPSPSHPVTPSPSHPVTLSPSHPVTLSSLPSATLWLLDLLDPESGRVPNLGPNDGAYILPLTTRPFHDYRPVLQAASLAFLGKPAFGPGPWDEMALWLRQVVSMKSQAAGKEQSVQRDTWNILRGTSSWAYLRAARFTGRPGHADQLHLDLWWRGLNVAQDAGTFLYNAPPPWDNTLSRTAVHNTITVDGRDQMTHAGRFLWLDWAQARIVSHEKASDGAWERLTAQHDGYRRLGVIHQRVVTAFSDERWLIEDSLLPSSRTRSALRTSHSARLHWLLPDWPTKNEIRNSKFEIQESKFEIGMASPLDWILLRITGQLSSVQLVRAGELVFGTGPVSPIQGWTSPTYGDKIPALSVIIETRGQLPLTLTSEFIFPTNVQP